MAGSISLFMKGAGKMLASCTLSSCPLHTAQSFQRQEALVRLMAPSAPLLHFLNGSLPLDSWIVLTLGLSGG